MATDLHPRPAANLIERTASAYGYPLLVKHLLHTSLAHAPGQEIVYRDLKRYDYRSLRERIGRLASALALLGVEAGDTVAVMDWDSHRYLECYFAVPMMGAVLQTVNVRLSPEQILYTLNHAAAKVLLAHSDFLPMLEEIKDRIETVKTFVLLADTDHRPTSSLALTAEYEELLGSSSAEYDFRDFDENTRATTFYTTGTTGLPKGVYFSHRQLVLHTLAQLAAFGSAPEQGRFHRDDVYMPITPMFHVHAWGFPWAATAAGVKQVYPGRYAPDVLLKLIKTEGVTFTHGVPTILQMLLAAAEKADVDLSGLTMVIGGSSLSKALALKALDRGIDIYAGYGMSETGPVLTVAHLKSHHLTGNPDAQVEIRTRAGLAVPLVDLRIVDPDMKELARDGKATGEIVARAPWLTQGYFNNPEASEKLWAGGYLHTNDIGNIGPDGYVQITDRIKDVIKTGGEWVSSLELEDIISQHGGVSDVAVIGIKDEKWGERPLALVVRNPKASAEANEDDIKTHVKLHADRGVISKYGIPHKILFVEQVPKTSVGKIDKKALRQKYGDGA